MARLYKSTLSRRCQFNVDIASGYRQPRVRLVSASCRLRVDMCVSLVSTYIETTYRNFEQNRLTETSNKNNK